MPHNSFMIYVDEATAHRVRAHELVLWIGAFLPEYKVRPARARARAEASRSIGARACGRAGGRRSFGSACRAAQIASVLFDDDVDAQLAHDLYRFVVHYAGERPSAEMAAHFASRLAEQTPAGVEITKFEPIPAST